MMIESDIEIPPQRINQILKTIFELLWFEPQGLYVSDLIHYLKKSFPFTDYENGFFPFAPNIPRYEVIMRVGTIPLEKAGWLEKTKSGRWYITTFGRDAAYNYSTLEDVFSASIQAIKEWQTKEEKRIMIFDSDPFNSAQEFASSQIRQYLELMEIKDLRIVISSLLKALGCYLTWDFPLKEDNGQFDLVCSMDPLGLKPPRLVVHVAKFSEVSTFEKINEFSDRLGQNDTGIFFSFGGFSVDADQYSLDLKKPSIRLIDLDGFLNLWIQNIEKIDQIGISKFPIRPVHFLGVPGQIRLP
jgi:hypothetical protein